MLGGMLKNFPKCFQKRLVSRSWRKKYTSKTGMKAGGMSEKKEVRAEFRKRTVANVKVTGPWLGGTTVSRRW